MKTKKKTKTKKVLKTKTPAKRIKKAKQYPAHYLALGLIIFVVCESLVLAPATKADWSAGFSLLDVSSQVTSTSADIKFAFEPEMMAATGINDFYNQSALAMMQLMTPSDTYTPMMFVDGVNKFYQDASNQMYAILDLSNSSNSPNVPMVAGISISK